MITWRRSPTDTEPESDKRGQPSRNPLVRQSQGARVLVVDDAPVVREAIADALRAEGFEVDTAADGDEAIRIADARRPNIVLTDLEMPCRRGVDVVRHIRAQLPGSAVLVMTGYSGLHIEREVTRAGASACLEKPLDLDDLVARIVELSERQAAPRN